MPSPRFPASRSIRPQAKPPCGRFQRAKPAGPAPPGRPRPPPPPPPQRPPPTGRTQTPPPANFPAPDGPKPSACRLISLLASRRNQSPLCVKGGGAKRRRDRFGSGCNYFKMTGRSQLLLPKGASWSLLESAITDFFNTQKPPAIGPGVYSHCGCPVERGREEGLSPS